MGFSIRSRSQRGNFEREGRKQLVVVMRVKNEEERLFYSLESTRGLGCPVILLDDGSTDSTPDICKMFPWVEYHRQDLPTMNELRDRNRLLSMALEQRPRWIMTIDGDEVLSKRAPEEILRALGNAPGDVNVFRLGIAFMWDDKYRVDLQSGVFWHMRIFRVDDMVPGGGVGSYWPVDAKPVPSGLHCGCIPVLGRKLKSSNIQAWIKAYGYNNEADYERHFAFYNKYDPTMWSQLEIVGRLDSPLTAWDEDSLPTVKNPEDVQEYLAGKMKRQLAVWRKWTNEQIDGKDATDVPERLGPEGVKEARPTSGGGKARRGRPRLQRDECRADSKGS